MNKSSKNVLWGIFAVVLLVVVVVWMIVNPDPEHIEDTNGADNYSLQTITEQDVVALKMGARGAVSKSETHYDLAGLNFSSGVEYSAKKFTGVYLLHAETIFKGADIYVRLREFNVNEGNFAFYVVFDGEIVGQVEPTGSGISEFLLENVEKTGALEYIIAGESASFSFIASTDFE